MQLSHCTFEYKLEALRFFCAGQSALEFPPAMGSAYDIISNHRIRISICFLAPQRNLKIPIILLK